MRGRYKLRYPVDGQMLTREEIAGMLGISPGGLRSRRYKLGGEISYQAIVDMYRANLFGNRSDRSERHMVDGQWMTVRGTAELLGISQSYVRYLMQKHGSLAAGIHHYRDRKRGLVPQREPKKYFIKGQYMTRYAAAAKYGFKLHDITNYKSRHQCSYDTAVKRMLARREKRAVDRILRIIRE